jgi:hypothetical protein
LVIEERIRGGSSVLALYFSRGICAATPPERDRHALDGMKPGQADLDTPFHNSGVEP